MPASLPPDPNQATPPAALAEAATPESASATRRPRIGVITNRNLQSPWASTHYYAAKALARGGAHVTHVAGDFVRGSHADSVFDWFGRRFYRRSNKPFDLERYGEAIVEDINRASYDTVVAFHASSVASALEQTTCPIVYVTDATADLLQGYYHTRDDLTESELRGVHEGERRVIARADRVCVPTNWVAASVVDRYHAAPERVEIVEWGANLERFPDVEERDTDKPEAGGLELLFIGLDWRRKGADIAVRAVDELVRSGIDARLTVVGAELPRELRRPYVTRRGRLSRAVPSEDAALDKLLGHADLLLHPARAECFGHVLCEALACGTPVVATDTGGIAQCVTHGDTGVLLPPGSTPEEFAEAIRGLVSQRSVYQKMRSRAVEDFRARLNWDRWASRVLDLVAELRDLP